MFPIQPVISAINMLKSGAILVASNLLLPQLHAQTPAAPKPPADALPRRESSAMVSPEVHPDRTVTFRLPAAKAHDVSVSGEWTAGSTPLAKAEDGVWSVTVGPLPPDIYGYNLTIDGVAVADPANPWFKPMRAARTSAVQIPGDPPCLWEFQPVPHGSVRQHVYFSRSLGRERRLHVYTPPGYENNSSRYPVLYLFHGYGDNDATWTAFGRANCIADNLLARHQALPMIIVMTDGHALNASATSADLMPQNLEAFRDDLLGDVIPLIESTYRVKADRENRAIAGLSMGGDQSLTVGLKRRDLFAWVGGMSSYLPDADRLVAEDFPDGKSNLKLLWFACGKEDRLLEHSQKLSTALKERQIPHVFKETAGNHSWPVWRRYLGEVMPLLFVKTAAAAGGMEVIPLHCH